MFDGQDEYTRAIQNARLHTYSFRNQVNIRFFLLNLFIFMLLILLGYLGFNYLEKHSIEEKKTSVMGVSYTNPNYTMKDSELMDMINELESEVSTLEQEANMKKVVDNLIHLSERNSKNGYIETKIHKHENKALRTILVQHGDTLATLAEEFYGDSTAFNKIINANSSLDEESYTIYVGQKIYIPY